MMMINLMKLEFYKVKIRFYIIGLLIIILGLLFFANTSMYASIQDTPANSYSNILKLVNMAVMECFTIYGAILIAKVIIGEYVNRSILIMLSYPINPKLWMSAKLIIIGLFVMFGTLLGNICCIVFIVFRDHYWNIVNGNFSKENFEQIITMTITSMILNGLFILFPFVIGMIKKSISATIVASIIMAFLIQIMFTQTKNLTELIVSGTIFILFLILFTGVIFVFNIKIVNATE